MEFNAETFNLLITQGAGWIISVVPNFLLSLVVLFVGLWVIKRFVRFLGNVFLHKKVEPTLASFSTNLINIALKTLLIISVFSMLGVATASFVAVLGAAGLAVGLALQGNLSNFAGGALILIFKPFRVGDYIQSQGVEGEVIDINVFCTAINTLDNQKIFVPNGPLSSSVLVNLTSNSTRRVDVSVVFSGETSIDDVQSHFTHLLLENKYVLDNPAPFVSIEKFSDLGVHYTVRAWVKTVDYWDAYFSLHEQTKEMMEKYEMSGAVPMRIVQYAHLPKGNVLEKVSLNQRQKGDLQ